MDKFLNSIPVTSKSDLSPSQQETTYSSTQLNGAQPTFSSPHVDHGVHSTLSPKATPFQPHSVVLEKCMDKLVETRKAPGALDPAVFPLPSRCKIQHGHSRYQHRWSKVLKLVIYLTIDVVCCHPPPHVFSVPSRL